MKKIGIITLNGNFNYGNRLQTFALQDLVKSLGFEVETLINVANINKKNNDNIKMMKKIKERKSKDIYISVAKRIESYIYKDRLQQRSQIFQDFSSRYITEKELCIIENQIQSRVDENYSYFITGSDQVWNPYSKNVSSIEFLTFVPPEKRVSYAPSFGVSEIPKEYTRNYQLWLSEMPHLSVREETGATIIKKLTGRDSTVVLDPTMMLTKEKWLSISKTASYKPVKKYLLTYFLGDITKERKNKLQRIARENNLEIIHLAQIKHKKTYLSGPCEFIDYINSAYLFCTDSFHGAAFSILLGTPFIVFNREGNPHSMNSRIDTLLKKFNLESRGENKIDDNQLFEIDFSHTNILIEKEREKSFKYLKKALNIDV